LEKIQDYFLRTVINFFINEEDDNARTGLGQMSRHPEDCSVFSNAVSNLTNFLAGSIQQEYINGQWSYLSPNGSTEAVNYC
jgi:hypothetical protein